VNNMNYKDIKVNREFYKEEYSEYINLNQEDFIRIIAFKEIINSNISKVIDLQINNIEKAKPEQNVEFLKKHFKAYFAFILTGKIDKDYIEQRYELGKLFYKINLNSKWFLPFISLYLGFFSKLIDDNKTIGSLKKVFTLDYSIIIRSYQEEEIDNLYLNYNNITSILEVKLNEFSRLNSLLLRISNEFKMISVNSHIEANKIEIKASEGFKIVSKRIKLISNDIKNIYIDIKDINFNIKNSIESLKESFNLYLESIKK